jgi:hypothetical protein
MNLSGAFKETTADVGVTIEPQLPAFHYVFFKKETGVQDLFGMHLLTSGVAKRCAIKLNTSLVEGREVEGRLARFLSGSAFFVNKHTPTLLSK